MSALSLCAAQTFFPLHILKLKGEITVKLSLLFTRCLTVDYQHVANGGDYAVSRVGDRLAVFLEGSNGSTDWKNNLDFPAKPYKRMGQSTWFCHRGFLSVFRALEEYLAPLFADQTLRHVTVVGYSHGAALAVLAHEYVWYNRPDLRASLYGYGFGCPRVVWGPVSNELCARWENFTVVRCPDDAVTHLPPAILGYTHVGKMCELCEKGKYSPIDAHRQENILAELHRLEAEAK